MTEDWDSNKGLGEDWGSDRGLGEGQRTGGGQGQCRGLEEDGGSTDYLERTGAVTEDWGCDRRLGEDRDSDRRQWTVGSGQWTVGRTMDTTQHYIVKYG